MTDKSSTKSSTKLSTDKIREVLEEMWGNPEVKEFESNGQKFYLSQPKIEEAIAKLNELYRQEFLAGLPKEKIDLEDNSEHPNCRECGDTLYVQGWNDCREEMLRRMK